MPLPVSQYGSEKDSHPAINAKASTITSETTWDMNPSANSIVQRTENGKKNLENIAFRENGQDGRFSLKKPVELSLIHI